MRSTHSLAQFILQALVALSVATSHGTAAPDGTAVFYQFDNPDALGEDGSGNANTLVTATGAPAYSSSGKFGGALYLNGSSTMNQGGEFPTGVPTGNSPYTIALWEKDDGSTGNGGFVGWGNQATNQCNNFRFSGNNYLVNYWWGGNDWGLSGLSTNPKDGAWHHLVITWDGATRTMYVDGDNVGTRPGSGLNAQASHFVVGKTIADAHFKGWIDDLLIASRAFDPTEVTSLMAPGKEILSFGFPSFGPATIEGNNITLTVPSGTTVTALAPTYTHNGLSASPASASAQDFTSAQTYTITGADGTTQDYLVAVIVTVGSDYDTWATSYLPAVVGDPAADLDGDGLKNDLEYAFGLDPTKGDSVNPISIPLDKASGLVKYTRRKQSLANLTYTYESSTTLAGTWLSFVADSETSNNGDPVEEITVEVPDSLLTHPALFIRVKANN